MRDTIDSIEKDFNKGARYDSDAFYKDLKIRILIQIAKELRVLAQRSKV